MRPLFSGWQVRLEPGDCQPKRFGGVAAHRDCIRSIAGLRLRVWPAILVGAFLVNVWTQGSVATSLLAGGAARTGTLPAIARTAYAADADQQQALEAGYQMHLAKPVESDKPAAAVVSSLEQTTCP